MPETTTSSPFWMALHAAQSELPMIGRDTEGQAGNHKYKYAPLDTIWPKVREILTKHGLVWSCTPTIGGDGRFLMHYALMHAPSGDGITGVYPIQEGRPQDVGSALTYARRYALCAVLGLVVSGDDDDARTAQENASTGRTEPVEAGSQMQAEKNGLLYGLRHARDMDDLRDQWINAGLLGLQKDRNVIAAKDKRKAELNE